MGVRHLGRFRVAELAPNALLRAPRVPKPLATVRSRPSSAFLLMRFSNRSCALSATRWGDTTLRVKLSTPNLNPSTLNSSPDALRTFSEHPLTLSDGNFSLGSAAVGVSPLEFPNRAKRWTIKREPSSFGRESADPDGSGVRVAWETKSRKPRRTAKLRV